MVLMQAFIMAKKELPRYVIYQPNQQEFHICLEAKGKYLRWTSNYAPSMDVRFPRAVKRIGDIKTGDLPKKNIFDQGTYTGTRSDTRADAEKKLLAGTLQKNFAFLPEGKKLQGRFAFKRVQGGMVIQKFRDKYATEEDVLSGDLSRTIRTMIPDYDESKVVFERPQRKARQKPLPEPEAEMAEEIRADKRIGKTSYHFSFYTSGDDDQICLVTNGEGEVLVLRKQKKVWRMLAPASKAVVKQEAVFAAHAAALYDISPS